MQYKQLAYLSEYGQEFVSHPLVLGSYLSSAKSALLTVAVMYGSCQTTKQNVSAAL